MSINRLLRSDCIKRLLRPTADLELVRRKANRNINIYRMTVISRNIWCPNQWRISARENCDLRTFSFEWHIVFFLPFTRFYTPKYWKPSKEARDKFWKANFNFAVSAEPRWFPPRSIPMVSYEIIIAPYTSWSLNN